MKGTSFISNWEKYNSERGSKKELEVRPYLSRSLLQREHMKFEALEADFLKSVFKHSIENLCTVCGPEFKSELWSEDTDFVQ